jgi:hypothetical protein
MFSATIRRHFNFTSLIAVLTLVFAMSGGALAAKKYLITSTSQISPSVLKALKGKAGAAGAKGDTGAAGGQGAPGSAGSPGPAGPLLETLPSGKTLTGLWSLGQSMEEGLQLVTISYQLPLASPLAPTDVVVVAAGAETEEGECPGTAQNPEAEAGKLCVYTQEESKISPLVRLGDLSRGVALGFHVEEGGVGYGTWAVTAP